MTVFCKMNSLAARGSISLKSFQVFSTLFALQARSSINGMIRFYKPSQSALLQTNIVMGGDARDLPEGIFSCKISDDGLYPVVTFFPSTDYVIFSGMLTLPAFSIG